MSAKCAIGWMGKKQGSCSQLQTLELEAEMIQQGLIILQLLAVSISGVNFDCWH